MRRAELRILAGWMLVLGLFGLGMEVIAADEPREARMTAIVAAVCAEEARFNDIEYAARIIVRDTRRQDLANPAEVTSMTTRRVVFLGDRFYLRNEAYERRRLHKFRQEEISAYDGERTRSVIAGNCASIQVGRFQHPDIVPIHSLPLAHHGITFPLSVYLNGTEAVHAYLKYTPNIAASGAWNVFRKIEIRYEDEEPLDGLRCAKVRVDRWYQPNDPPVTQYLWLARERNFHCVKEQCPWYEMHVDELRELAPGIWFPAKITIIEYDQNARNQAKKIVVSQTNTIVDEINLAPRHDTGFFREVAVPRGLPVFTIKDRALVGSTLPSLLDDRGPTKLAELAARVAAQEKRYDDIEVKARVSTKYFNPNKFLNPRNDWVWNDHSLLRGDLAYFKSLGAVAQPDGWQDRGGRVHAHDGLWTRVVQGENFQQPETLSAVLQKGKAKEDHVRDGISVYRPHMLMLRKWRMVCTLTELLRLPPGDPIRRAAYHFRHCGEAVVDGHPCNVIRCDYFGGPTDQTDSFVMYLASDRNDIPIKMELYQESFGNKMMPRTISRCSELREIAPGLWFPTRVTDLDLGGGLEVAPEWLLLSSRSDITIESVTLAPKASDAIFRDVIVPMGARVQVIDEDGYYIGQYAPTRSGVASLTTVEYLKLLSTAVVKPSEMEARKKAIDALIGKPAPEFSPGAAWTNGRPLTWQALGGRVVVIGFWAEWSAASRVDLMRLGRLHHDGGTNGLTIVGVHPPGSELAAIKKVTDEMHLEFPTCVDLTPLERARAWGDLFGRFAVRAIPFAMAVDADGKVVAYGRLEDVLAKARALVAKGL